MHALGCEDKIMDLILDSMPLSFEGAMMKTDVIRGHARECRWGLYRQHGGIKREPLSLYPASQKMPMQPYFRPPAAVLDNADGREFESVFPTQNVNTPVKVHRVADLDRSYRLVAKEIYHGDFAISSLIARRITAARGQGSPVFRRSSRIHRSRASSSSAGRLNEKRFSVRIGSYFIDRPYAIYTNRVNGACGGMVQYPSGSVDNPKSAETHRGDSLICGVCGDCGVNPMPYVDLAGVTSANSTRQIYSLVVNRHRTTPQTPRIPIDRRMW